MKGFARGVLVILALGLSGCRLTASLPEQPQTFAGYQRQTVAMVEAQRAFQSLDKQAELRWNTPQEWRPQGTARRGILLVHGLGDSPGSFSDLGPALARQGFLVRSVLLPGHGTRPADLIDVSVNQWRSVVREQAAILAREVPEVWLGGFSTGGNLALEYAYRHPQVAGLLLFSPALKSRTPYDFLAPPLALVRDWLRPPSALYPQQIATRYLRVPTNGFAQYYHTSSAVRRLIARQTYPKPTLVVMARHDSVVDSLWVLGQFSATFTHPRSRLIWYGDLPDAAAQDSRILTRSDALPEERISQFSHMSVLFAPENPVYGRRGSQRLCGNGQAEESARRCLAGETVWYSDWGLQEAGRIHARLTWNPWFNWQQQIIGTVTGAGAPGDYE
ncbi:alpha/beta fold hydrolase [Entomohabitans teleogrylli]|uniref:alpha/beta fold hydrolase n=1 Tax=Entomohabitans teleogrylli TaxID=1384589 RepID=UPI00073D2002|nr:alpha/beta fold hydrolase [Entomohabitans teleogrylli]